MGDFNLRGERHLPGILGDLEERGRVKRFASRRTTGDWVRIDHILASED
jgi:hypothetical protein